MRTVTAMCDTPSDPPLTQHRSLNNKLHKLALLSPARFAAVEAFVDQALAEASADQARSEGGSSKVGER